MNTRLLSMIVLTLALLLYEEMPAQPADAVPQVLLESSDFEIIASETLESGYRLDILKSPDGTIMYAESAPIQTGLKKLTKDIVNALTPAEVFARALPGVKVPDSLLSTGWLHERHTPMPEPDSDGEFDDVVPDHTAAEAIEDLSEVDRDGQMSIDTQPSGEEQNTASALSYDPTGLTGCPTWWFASTFPGCPNDSDHFCLYNAAWAFLSNTKGIRGQGIVCTDSGTAQFEVTQKSQLATYTIPAGNYIAVYVAKTTHCGCACFLCLCYSCDLTDEKFIKFDLKPSGANSHFKAYIDHF
jgi:hypothetical protein